MNVTIEVHEHLVITFAHDDDSAWLVYQRLIGNTATYHENYLLGFRIKML